MSNWNPPVITKEDEEKVYSFDVLPDGTKQVYNLARDPKPAAKGNNKSRFGFLYNPYYHPLGKWFQGTLKSVVLGMIDTVHSGLMKYDKEAYVYEDVRLQKLDEAITKSINELFSKAANGDKKMYFMHQCRDIALFLMKEDVAYRWRWISLLQSIGEAVKDMEPTIEEIQNMEYLKKK